MGRNPVDGRGQRGTHAIGCRHCRSVRTLWRSRISAHGWALQLAAIGNLALSVRLMDWTDLGYLTIFVTPVFAALGFFECRRLVIACAGCGRPR